jgi:hypothetical protein
MLIPPTYRLLHSGYEYRDILLDLYGECDEDGPDVRDVALVGDKRSLVELFPASVLEDMGHFVERRMSAARRESVGEGRAEIARWHRENQRSPGP